MNFSSWDSVPSTKRYNPSFSPAHVIVEFERTKRPKIFAHKLGRIDFSKRRDINAERQKIIEQEKGNLTLNGFKYKNIGHVYSDPQVILPNDDGVTFNVLAHGHPLGGTEYGGLESCSRAGLKCAEGEGISDGLCSPGKCIIGILQRIKATKWKYESANTYGLQELPVVYYVPAAESVVLKSISRGHYITYNEEGEATQIGIDKPASVTTKIYLPPKFYYSESFLDSLLVYEDSRLKDTFKSPTSSIIGIETRKENFIRGIALKAYPDSTEGVIINQMNNIAPEAIRDALIDTFTEAPGPWPTQCKIIIEEEFSYRFARQYSGIEYVAIVYDRVYELFSSILQVTESSLSPPRLSYDKKEIARPIYSRLPGIAESYRSDPAFSDKETPAQWLTSGVDDFLSKKKDSIASFYQTYLDPETCSTLVLDWLAQHVGLTGELWNTTWDRKTKETLINNSFGWWDREISDSKNNLTPKGVVLNKFPFTLSQWTDDEEQSNLLNLKLDEIETIIINPENNEIGYNAFKTKVFSKETQSVSIETINIFKINKLLWNGLIEAKGSLLCIAFLVSLFGLKSHIPQELEFIDLQKKILKPKTGLRNAEFEAPPIIPYKPDVIQVGTIQDAEVGNYTNQLIAGVSRVSSIEESRNVIFRVPYYYNRDGMSWDKTIYISKNWLPGNLNTRTQYAYLSADLWSVGDSFFEPEIVEITER